MSAPALLNAALAGRYEIEREIGAGGMATVYLAHDKKHDRKVAMKVLHAELAAVLGADRFLQEIRVTANLQHPHILGLIDSGLMSETAGEFASRPYYVMPYVEGQSLRQRLNQEQQLPVAEAVRMTTEVAAAIDYAHRHGVIHRDIKPENILLHDGSAIVADFGIALAVTQAGGARMTQTGLSLGTPSYMSPEQAMGEKVITARSDIYSLGAVCYEMLSGEPPFTGPTVQAIVARVMTEEPRSLTVQRKSVPPHVAAAVSQALEKVPADRFGSAHEFAEALKNSAFTQASGALAASGALRAGSKRVLYAVSALAVLMTAIALWGWMRSEPPKRVLRYPLVFDSTEAMIQGGAWTGRIALSPDGSRLAYIGGPRKGVLIRQRNELHATHVAGSEGGMTPFFSPDGKSLGVMYEDTLRVFPLAGGPAILLTDTLVGVAGASWGRDGFIYADGRLEVPLVRVEAKRGGVPRWFTSLDTASGETDHVWPDVVPNGKGVVFTTISRKTAQGRTSFAIAVAEIPSGKHHVLVNDAMFARYASGHLLYVTTNRALMLVPFDQSSLKVTGEPIHLADGLRLGSVGSADVAVSTEGTLLYTLGPEEGSSELVWVTRGGQAQRVDSTWQGFFYDPALSPDGTRVAVDVGLSTYVIWVKQLDAGPELKAAFDGTQSGLASWSPDGRSLTFSSNSSGSDDLWSKKADGSANAIRLFHWKYGIYGPLWSPDGKWLIFRTTGGSPGAGDILGIRPGIDTTPVPLIATKSPEFAPALSPDGRWLAYVSNETGLFEVYVVPFPNTGSAKWVVSNGGGTEPQWSRRGNELFYRDADQTLVAVAVTTQPTFSPGRSTRLFSSAGYSRHFFAPQYVPAPDARRFLMIRSVNAAAQDKLIVVENWFEELRTKARR